MIKKLSHEIFNYLWIEWALGHEPSMEKLCYDFGYAVNEESIDIHEAIIQLQKLGWIKVFHDKKTGIRRLKKMALL